jgi:hypothetical protein
MVLDLKRRMRLFAGGAVRAARAVTMFAFGRLVQHDAVVVDGGSANIPAVVRLETASVVQSTYVVLKLGANVCVKVTHILKMIKAFTRLVHLNRCITTVGVTFVFTLATGRL